MATAEIRRASSTCTAAALLVVAMIACGTTITGCGGGGTSGGSDSGSSTPTAAGGDTDTSSNAPCHTSSDCSEGYACTGGSCTQCKPSQTIAKMNAWYPGRDATAADCDVYCKTVVKDKQCKYSFFSDDDAGTCDLYSCVPCETCKPQQVIKNMNGWYPARKATAQDCSFYCRDTVKDPKCLHSKFSTDNDGTCVLYPCLDKCSQTPAILSAEEIRPLANDSWVTAFFTSLLVGAIVCAAMIVRSYMVPCHTATESQEYIVLE